MARDLLSDDSSDSDSGGASVPAPKLKVNQDYAKRFEHNKKREELQKLEDKIGSKSSKKRKRDEDASDSESLSSSEDEDEEAELATEALDTEISAMITAIKSKDPRIYDPQATFLTQLDENAEPSKTKQEKALYLKDYHRQNLLNGANTEAARDAKQPLSYNQEQDALRASVVGAMHAAAANESSNSSSSSEDEDDNDEETFLKPKSKQKHPTLPLPPADPSTADRDPETFLSNFMSSRAWLPTDSNTYAHAFESDDSDQEKKADEFEEAYNMRFEDPHKSNETLRSHARDMAAKYSVRRDEMNPRQKRREAERAKKDAEKLQAKEDKARLKKLRMEEVEDKVKRIKRAAGLKADALEPQDWLQLLNDDWDDDKWEQEMQKRFNEDYYALDDLPSADEDTADHSRKPKKPKFDDDIDINDIVPDFEDADDVQFSLSDEDQPAKQKQSHKQAKQEKQKAAKRERRIIEQLVNDQLQLELQQAVPNASKAAGFRYRQTSPDSFGLTARDILLADDKQLNEFVGLKKLAAWRDPEKKAKDKKRLGKKARLRKWRLDTFGDEDGLQDVELVPEKASVVARDSDDDADGDGGVNIRTQGKKKGRRRKKQKPDSTIET